MLRKLLSLHRYPEFIKLVYWRVFIPMIARKQGVYLGNKVVFYGKPIISMESSSQIILEDKVNLCSASEFTALGVNHPIVLRTLRPNAKIKIGQDTGISGASICAAISIEIGRSCLIGANVIISDSDFHSLSPNNRRHNSAYTDIKADPILIGDNVFIGTGAIILKGVTIGNNSIVGAGAVVTKSIPDNAIYAGNPAKIISFLQ